MKKQQTSTTPSCCGPIPAHKSRANSVPGAIYSHLMFECYCFHRFSWEKIHQNDRSHALVISTPSCCGPIPAHKSRANSVPGAIYSHLMFECYCFHRFSWEKIHQNDRSHALVISIIPGPIKIYESVKNYPPWTMVVLK